MLRTLILLLAAMLIPVASAFPDISLAPTPTGADFDVETTAPGGSDDVELDVTAGGYGTLDIEHVYKWNPATGTWDEITGDCSINDNTSNPTVDLPGAPAAGDKYRFTGRTSTRPTGGQNDISDKTEATWLK